MNKRNESEECIVDSKQPSYSKYTSTFIEDVNAGGDDSLPPNVKTPLDMSPNLDASAPNHTNRSQDMINMCTYGCFPKL